MRRLLPILLAVTLATTSASAGVRFVAPLAGAQAIGPQLIEVATDSTSIDRVDFFVDGVFAGVTRQAPWRIAYDFGTQLDARTIVAKVWSSGYEKSETATLRTAAMTASESIDVDLVEVPVRVRSSRALSAGDFRVRENGVEQTIRDVRRERPPVHFAFVLDRSLSMNDGKLAASALAIERALGQLRPGDTASLVLFNHNVTRPQPLARGARLAAMLERVVPSGGTSLRDAVASIATGERTYAIVITDGGDRNSQLDEERALQTISGTKTIAHAVVLGNSHTRFLDKAAKSTGGSVVTASKESVANAVGEILEDINSRYTVIYQSSIEKRGWRTIDVKPRRGGLAILNARKGYFAR